MMMHFLGCLILPLQIFFPPMPEKGDLLSKMEPGIYYEVLSSNNYGILYQQPSSSWFEEAEILFYADKGTLYADPLKVELDNGGVLEDGFSQMVLPDGKKLFVEYRPYEAPEYREFPKISLYTKPRFQVEETYRRYGRATGFWTSYPCDPEESFAVIFARKLPYLVSMDRVDLTMDIYTPKDDGDHLRPLVVMIHGGAFFNGDKADEAYVKWCRHFASLGYVAISVNYRLGFRTTHNEIQRAGYRALQDVNAAVRYIVSRPSYRVNPDMVFTAGTSAGGITALNLAFMEEEDRPPITFGGTLGDEGKIDSINPEDNTPFTIKAVGNMWGAVQDLGMLLSKDVAVISYHSEDDEIVPSGRGYPFKMLFRNLELNSLIFERMYGSVEIERTLRRAGRQNELHLYPGNVHSLHKNEDGSLSEVFYEIQDGLTNFFRSVMEEDQSVNLRQESPDSGTFLIDSTNVSDCYWKVTGGVIRSASRDEVKILLFPDAPEHSLTVSGHFRYGFTFKETLDL